MNPSNAPTKQTHNKTIGGVPPDQQVAFVYAFSFVAVSFVLLAPMLVLMKKFTNVSNVLGH